MYMSPEMITMILTGVGTVVTMLGVFFAMYRHSETRLDRRFEQAEQRNDLRFEQVDKRFELIDRRFEQVDKRFEQIDKRFEQVDKRFEQIDERFQKQFAAIRGDLVELQVSVARIEGPQPRLLRAH